MKKVITIIGIFGLILVQAQVGINTDTPQATLDIKSEVSTLKALKITNSANTEIVTVTDDGKVGIGEQPNTKLNLYGRTFKLGYAYEETNTAPTGYRIIESDGRDLKLAPPLDDGGWVKINDSNTDSFLGFSANGYALIRAWKTQAPPEGLTQILMQTTGLSIGGASEVQPTEKLDVHGNIKVHGVTKLQPQSITANGTCESGSIGYGSNGNFYGCKGGQWKQLQLAP